ncbi:hypothetical protein CEK28_17745 [Xenophilus sp. AP218F]|nr:hypothetical protein [Chromobacterium sp. ASV5]OWY37244.1 hypothetical protein CEK28_17745 [Xenophilus sp. AP218F]
MHPRNRPGFEFCFFSVAALGSGALALAILSGWDLGVGPGVTLMSALAVNLSTVWLALDLGATPVERLAQRIVLFAMPALTLLEAWLLMRHGYGANASIWV